MMPNSRERSSTAISTGLATPVATVTKKIVKITKPITSWNRVLIATMGSSTGQPTTSCCGPTRSAKLPLAAASSVRSRRRNAMAVTASGAARNSRMAAIGITAT